MKSLRVNTPGVDFLTAMEAVLASLFMLFLAQPGQALHAYGHAYSRPHDFTDAQISAVAARFEIFTVEKGSAQDIYGPRSSIAATIATAKRIKAVNDNVKVLMYWNAAMHYDMYECETEVQPSWLIPGPGHHKQAFYNYSVSAFREWWVRCALTAVARSGGLLSGVFLDATPKVADGQCYTKGPMALAYWGSMVDQIRAELGPDAVVIDNGFFLAGKYPHNIQLAGMDAWKHSGTTYTESVAAVGMDKAVNPEKDIADLRWIAEASASAPSSLQMIGHGTFCSDGVDHNDNSSSALDPEFEFGLAKYLLVTRTVQDGWFLANCNYSIDGGLLQQPMRAYGSAGLGCGEPIGPFVRTDHVLSRAFEHGNVSVDIRNGTGSIRCE